MSEYAIKELTLSDLHPDLLKQYNRYQEYQRFYIRRDSAWVLMDRVSYDDWDEQLKRDIFFVEDWDEKRRTEIATEEFPHIIKTGGSVFGIFNEAGYLIAFANMLADRFGPSREYVQLKRMHVSRECRSRGMGKQLFKRCMQKAKDLGAAKIYISANFSEETQAFYASLGCVDAQAIDQDLAAAEPYDRQMEYVL
jgi:N-acetylglutamate synthase-like GNAT family acetyltransferase